MDCIVFDVDGTLADGTHRNWLIQTSGQPKQWDVYFGLLHEDKLIEPIAIVCRALAKHIQIIYCTGRPGQYIPQTHQWLRDNDLPFGPIYYRPERDFTNDDQLKLRLIEDMKRDGFNPILFFDDRTRVVLALRKAGYLVAQVANGDF